MGSVYSVFPGARRTGFSSDALCKDASTVFRFGIWLSQEGFLVAWEKSLSSFFKRMIVGVVEVEHGIKLVLKVRLCRECR